jgi:hypothetical protein
MNAGGVTGSTSGVQTRYVLPIDLRTAPSVTIAVGGTWNISDNYASDVQASAMYVNANSLGVRGGVCTSAAFQA